MEGRKVRNYYQQEGVVEHYASAAAEVGLWISEEKIFRRVFRPDDEILELGCGAGRIALGLWEIGYDKVFATDFARKMVAKGRALAVVLEASVRFGVQDATKLQFSDQCFDGAIFGFNGLMQIPGRANRCRAMSEVHRVLRPGGYFVFTSHDRQCSPHQGFWKQETERWRKGEQDPDLDDFGDRVGDTRWGDLYIHVPVPEEIRADLKAAGFRVEADVLRSRLADEPPEVKAFSDDCRFWVAQRPE